MYAMTRPSSSGGATPLADADPLCRMGAAELHALYAAGTVSPVDVAKAALKRAEWVSREFNAFALIEESYTLQMARASEERWRAKRALGPMDGMPATIKDIFWIRDLSVRYGCKAIPATSAVEDAPAVCLLRKAGVVIIGLTTTPEFGWKAVTDSPGFGITRNPWDSAKTPGGSSGGAAVAAATGAGVFHLGTDGGGSIRIPAAFTAVVGHKPTFGRVPLFPMSPFGTLANAGPITRSVADAALMLEVMSQRDRRDWSQPITRPLALHTEAADLKGRRIGVWSTPPSGVVAPEVTLAFEVALKRLQALGAQLEPVSFPSGDLPSLFNLLWRAGAGSRLKAIPPQYHAALDPGFLHAAHAGQQISATDYIEAGRERALYGAAFDEMVERYDVIVSPAVSVLPFEVGHDVPPGCGNGLDWAGFTYPLNLAQAPACVVPSTRDPTCLSIGLQFLGRRGDDGAVLAAAAAYERSFEQNLAH